MQKRNALIPPLITLSILLPFIALHAAEDETSFLREFLAGNYTLIGREVDGGVPFTGRVSLTQTESGLTVTRTIENRNTVGIGNIETATADNIPVLRLRFSEGDIAFEATCLIGSDLDNYPRLTCQRYRADGATKLPALEALFITPRQ